MNAMHDDDEVLRRALAEPGPHVDDGGFTERVMARLPPPRRRRSARGAILAGSVVLGAVALWFSQALPFVGDTLRLAATAPGGTPQPALLAAVALVAALVCTGAYAFHPD